MVSRYTNSLARTRLAPRTSDYALIHNMVIFLGAFLADVSIVHVAMMIDLAALTANAEIFFVVQNAADVFFLVFLPLSQRHLV